MTGRVYVALIGLLLAGLALAETTRPTPLDTRVRLERVGSAPFDAEVFFEALGPWLGQPVEVVAEPPFDRLADSTLAGRTYVVLAQTFAPDAAEAERLLRFVERGNALFVAAAAFGGPLGEALGSADSSASGVGLRTDWPLETPFELRGSVDSPDTLRLLAPGVAGAYGFPVEVRGARIRGLDPSRTVVLGDEGDRDAPTLVRVRHGAGTVVLSSTPLALSNAALTGEGDAAAYVAGVLAALPDQPVLWDDHHKPFRSYAATPLRYVLQTPALRWAYGLALAAFVLFVAFRGRRWQRPIPVVAPPPNAQREFAQTIGRLHLAHGDDRRLAERKAEVVLDRLRTVLRISDPDLSPATARIAAARAGVPEDEARTLFATLDRVRRDRHVDADTLVRLDRRIDAFFRHTPGAPGADTP